MQEKPEILSPAGSVEALKAAIAAGCDAVYIGGSRFGARAYAQNPNKDGMLRAIAYCHLHGVKLYMTVNTLLKEREMQDGLFSFLRPYYEAGLDAVIVQDVGVLRFISSYFPELPIHASTQMALTMGKGTEQLKKYHVTRIIPARELTLPELRQMRQDTALELEVFVHGALCYCYSGQCLFSSMFGGRSGNRGRCAQPCRMPYVMAGQEGAGQNGTQTYLLSPKELCGLALLPELIEAGMNSFKMEGRMKRAEYTAFVTAVYRKYTDLYFALGKRDYQIYIRKHKKEWDEDLRCLAELYNREGFTQGYLEGMAGDRENRHFGKKGQMLASLRPNHGGVCVGKVQSVGRQEVTYQATKGITAQDVVEFRNARQKPSYEYTVGKDILPKEKITARYKKGSRIQAGDQVYRTKDAKLLDKIQKRFLYTKKQVGITGRFVAECGKAAVLGVQWKQGQKTVYAECFGEICQEAQTRPVDEETVRRVLGQTGNSLFDWQALEIVLGENLFVSVGMLKKLRREAFAALEQAVAASFRRQADSIPEEKGKENVLGDGMVQRIPEEKAKQNSLEKDLCQSALETMEDKGNEEGAGGGRDYLLSASIMDWGQLEAVLQCPKADIIYLRTEKLQAEELKEAFYAVKKARKMAWLEFPVIFRHSAWKMFGQESKRRGGIFSLAWDGFLVKNRESLQFLLGTVCVPAEKIRLDFSMYVMNRQAYDFWKEQGIDKMTAPLEATAQELKQLSFLPQMELLVYGRIPLMVSAQCVLANTSGCRMKECQTSFSNQKGQMFVSANYCKYCYNILYQEEPLFIKEMAENEKLSVSSFRYAFTLEDREEVAKVLAGKISRMTCRGHFWHGVE